MTDISELKRQAGVFAADMVESGMVVGLGHGSTAIHAVRHIAARIQSGDLEDIVGIPASNAVKDEALELGIPLTTFVNHRVIDITIDGADEVDPDFNVIKGGGGALLHEKIVAQASNRFVVVVDERKQTEMLGTRFFVPVEVIPFGYQSQLSMFEALGAEVKLRMTGESSPFVTDEGNYVLDCNFGPIKDVSLLSAQLLNLATVVEHGLFVGITTDLVVATQAGVIHLEAE